MIQTVSRSIFVDLSSVANNIPTMQQVLIQTLRKPKAFRAENMLRSCIRVTLFYKKFKARAGNVIFSFIRTYGFQNVQT